MSDLVLVFDVFLKLAIIFSPIILALVVFHILHRESRD